MPAPQITTSAVFALIRVLPARRGGHDTTGIGGSRRDSECDGLFEGGGPDGHNARSSEWRILRSLTANRVIPKDGNHDSADRLIGIRVALLRIVACPFMRTDAWTDRQPESSKSKE